MFASPHLAEISLQPLPSSQVLQISRTKFGACKMQRLPEMGVVLTFEKRREKRECYLLKALESPVAMK